MTFEAGRAKCATAGLVQGDRAAPIGGDRWTQGSRARSRPDTGCVGPDERGTRSSPVETQAGRLEPTRASKPEMTSKSSSSMPLWRKRWKEPLRLSSNSSMFLSARSMAAKRLAFSLARDSAHARKS